MDQAEPQKELFESLASASDERQKKIEAVLAAFNKDKVDVAYAIENIAVLLHDHVGDAELLGLHTVSQAAAELEKLLKAWQERLLPSDHAADLNARIQQAVHSEAFSGWLEELTRLSIDACAACSDEQCRRELQNLRLEFTKAYQESRPPTYSGVQAVLRRQALVLDDSKISRKILSTELERRDYLVATAANREELWEHIEAGLKPTLVLLDYNIPEVKGDEVCRALRMDPKTRDVVIIFFSSLPEEALAEIARNSCANGFISKQDGVAALHSYLDGLEADGLI